MAIIPSTNYAGQIDTGDAAYPQGKAKNVTTAGDGTGTPLEAAWVNDLWGFKQALLDAAGITPSGTPDEVGASQYLTALLDLISTRAFVWTGRLDLDVAPSVVWQKGIVTNSDLIPSGNNLDVQFSANVVSSTSKGGIFITGHSIGQAGVIWQAQFTALNAVRLTATLHDGTSVNIASAGRTDSIYLMVAGD